MVETLAPERKHGSGFLADEVMTWVEHVRCRRCSMRMTQWRHSHPWLHALREVTTGDPVESMGSAAVAGISSVRLETASDRMIQPTDKGTNWSATG